MTLLVGKSAPSFKSTAAFANGFKEIKLEDYRGKYIVLFFYPLNFTFVCPTELHAFQEKLSEFEKLDATVLACSVDSQFSHNAWLNTPPSQGGIEGIQYGIVADVGGEIAKSYDVLHADRIAYRALFLIDREGVVRHQSVNDLPLGRNVDEVIRLLQALQHTEQHGEVCPANWNKGDDAIKPTLESVSDYLAS